MRRSKRAIQHALQIAGENEEMRSLNLRALGSKQFLESTRAFIGAAGDETDGQPEGLEEGHGQHE